MPLLKILVTVSRAPGFNEIEEGGSRLGGAAAAVALISICVCICICVCISVFVFFKKNANGN